MNPVALRWLCVAAALMALPSLWRQKTQPITPPPASGPVSKCVCCDGAGWVGESDCKCCDWNGDGDYVDPLPPNAPKVETPPEPLPEPEPEIEAPPEPVNFFKDIKEEAYVLAEQNGLGVLVLVSPDTSDPKTCEPCELFHSAIQRDFETRGAKSPFIDWVGWKVYQDEADHGKAISSLTKFPYVYLTTIGEADEEGVHTPEVLWHGHVRYPQDFDRFLKVLEKLSSNNRSEK